MSFEWGVSPSDVLLLLALDAADDTCSQEDQATTEQQEPYGDETASESRHTHTPFGYRLHRIDPLVYCEELMRISTYRMWGGFD